MADPEHAIDAARLRAEPLSCVDLPQPDSSHAAAASKRALACIGWLGRGSTRLLIVATVVVVVVVVVVILLVLWSSALAIASGQGSDETRRSRQCADEMRAAKRAVESVESADIRQVEVGRGGDGTSRARCHQRPPLQRRRTARSAEVRGVGRAAAGGLAWDTVAWDGRLAGARRPLGAKR